MIGNKFSVFISEDAEQDIIAIVSYIRNIYHAPETSKKFFQGIIKVIKGLQYTATIYPVKEYKSIFYCNSKRVNYKGFAIIYTIENKTIIVHRVVHGSLLF
jgi:plasmid stabilization system protein ParE